MNFQPVFFLNNKCKFIQTNSIFLIDEIIYFRVECKILLESFRQRINYRQKRFKRIENLQKLLLSSTLIDRFIEMISDLGRGYFTSTELDYLEDIKLIDIGVLAILLTLPLSNPLAHQIMVTPNYLHIIDPVIEKYSTFLTTIILRILSKRERFDKINEILLFNSEDYLSVEEVLKVCIQEKLLTHDNIEIKDNTTLESLFDYILHLNHQTTINEQIRQLFSGFKPLAIYKAQLLIEKELNVIKLLLRRRKKQAPLTVLDLNRYLEAYPIPCRL